MIDGCSHEAAIRDVTPSALGCEECLKNGMRWVQGILIAVAAFSAASARAAFRRCLL